MLNSRESHHARKYSGGRSGSDELVLIELLFSQVNPSAVIKYEPVKDANTKLMARTVGLHVVQLGPEHFVRGKLAVSII